MTIVDSRHFTSAMHTLCESCISTASIINALRSHQFCPLSVHAPPAFFLSFSMCLSIYLFRSYFLSFFLRMSSCKSFSAVSSFSPSSSSLFTCLFIRVRYLCTLGMLHLGLPSNHTLWTAPAARWTSARVWASEDLKADHALSETRPLSVKH